MPAVGAHLTVEVRGRSVAVIGADSVGSIPTRLNYLARCLQAGFSYTGIVTASSSGANPQLQADFVVR